MNFSSIVLGILLTAIAYLAFPLIKLLINKGKFPKNKAHKIALWNSIVLGLVFCIATIGLSEGNATWNAAPAVLYYWINRAILTNKNAEENNKPCDNNIGSNCQSINPDLDIDTMSPKEAAEYLFAEQLGEKYIPKEKQDKKARIKFCSHCGSPIDSISKKCTGCGKQYFKLKFTKLSAIVIALVLVIVAISTLIVFKYFNTQELEVETDDFEYQSSTKQSNTSNLSNKPDLEGEFWENIDLERVAFIEDDGTNLFHKYECHKFKGESYLILDVKSAIWQGYTACQYCH